MVNIFKRNVVVLIFNECIVGVEIYCKEMLRCMNEWKVVVDVSIIIVVFLLCFLFGCIVGFCC